MARPLAIPVHSCEPPVYTYLTMTHGPSVGKHFMLDPTDENRMGRGLECDIILADPLCSRVHAVALQDEDGWWLIDSRSRNGTYVNEQKIDRARLIDGNSLRLGSTIFDFHHAAQAPTELIARDLNLTQTIIRDTPISPLDTNSFATAALRDAGQANEFLTLYQLSIGLLSCETPDQVTRMALDVVLERTKASVVGFMWVSDEGQLKPKVVIPEDEAGQVTLSHSLTDIVTRQKRAVWIAQQAAVSTQQDSLQHYADAMCVPLIHSDRTVGAIHLYSMRGKFNQLAFEFCISVANILVIALVKARSLATLQAEHQRLVDSSANFDELIGDSDPMVRLKGKITRIARATGCVLIRGESGAGKELVARAMHKASARADRPMLSVNCAAIPPDLMESQLFGHKKGSFTGADKDHAGWFQQADSGTLFLDEVGEMTLEGQAKLLRILEGHPFLPVGGNQEIRVDVRVIAATNRDLREFVREKRFREDLYYRLSVFELYIPPLRERGSDLEMLVMHFLEHFKRKHGQPNLRISDAARQKLLAYSWPGNVRQLRNVIDSAIVMSDGDTIRAEDLGLRDAGGGELDTLRIDHWEQKLIREALSRTSFNVPEAAKLLGIGRATLYRKLEEYGIERKGA